ncbi:MAG: hypothetical protein HRU38_15035 [Saccharospirillaceae bacterium]|nr:hypothetical protein [Pseudomonadales bacterium]NRB79956.1 hypothetical protein [Saccharospirillaceae bacterium]
MVQQNVLTSSICVVFIALFSCSDFDLESNDKPLENTQPTQSQTAQTIEGIENTQPIIINNFPEQIPQDQGFVHTVDIDLDGDIDFVSVAEQKIIWYENIFQASYINPLNEVDNTTLSSIYIADVDNDDDLDILSATKIGNHFNWYENDGSIDFNEHLILSDSDLNAWITTENVESNLSLLSNYLDQNAQTWLINNIKTKLKISALSPVGASQLAGQPSSLSSIGMPTTPGKPSIIKSNTNIDDRFTAGAVTNQLSYYQTINTPTINSITAGLAVNMANLFATNNNDQIEITIDTGESANISAVITPYVTGPTSMPEVIAGLQTAINNSATLAGHVLVREDPTSAGYIEIYSTDGTTFPLTPAISIPLLSVSSLADDLGFGVNNNSANYARLLLNDVALGEPFDINYIDALGNPQTLTLNLWASNYASISSLIADLQTQIDSSVVGPGIFVVQLNPFYYNAIEIVPDINAGADADYAITSIVNNGFRKVAQNLGLTNGQVGVRYFQNPPNPTDTIQIQLQDPNIYGGTPYTALLRPFREGIEITNMVDLLASFQTQLNEDDVLSGRVNIQEDPNNTGQFQLISSTGTRVTAVTDLVGSIAQDLQFTIAPTIDPSIFANLPPLTPSKIAISIEGPKLNQTMAVTQIIEPFPAGSIINNMNDLVNSFQSSIDANQNLAGKLRVSEDPLRKGYLQIETFASYATDGTNLLSINDHEGSLALDLGLDLTNITSPTVNTAIAGVALFDNGGSIDLTTIEGTPVTVQGNLVSEFVFRDFQPGTQAVLTGYPLPVTPYGASVAGGTFNMTIVSGSNSDTVIITVPAGGFLNRTDLANAVSLAFAGSAHLSGVVNAWIDSSNRLYLTNVQTGAQFISVFEAGNTLGIAYPNPVQDVLGLTSGSSPQPTLSLGTAKENANNELTFTVGGDDPGIGSIRIPSATYTTTDQIVDAINAQITATPQVTGKVSATNINGRIVFNLTKLGGFPNTLNVTGSDEALEAFGHSSQSTPPAIDPIDRRNSFRINLSVPFPDEYSRSGSVVVSLNEHIRSIEQLASAINRELNAAEEDNYIGVRTEVNIAIDGSKTLTFVATVAGEAAKISISHVWDLGADITEQELYAMLQVDHFNETLLVIGEPDVRNGYPEQRFVIYDRFNDISRVIMTEKYQQASQIASEFSKIEGVFASAKTQVLLSKQGYINSGLMDLYINGQIIQANNFIDIRAQINQYSQTTLQGISASFYEQTEDLLIKSNIGTDIEIEIISRIKTDSLSLSTINEDTKIILGGLVTNINRAVVGGEVNIQLQKGYSIQSIDENLYAEVNTKVFVLSGSITPTNNSNIIPNYAPLNYSYTEVIINKQDYLSFGNMDIYFSNDSILASEFNELMLKFYPYQKTISEEASVQYDLNDVNLIINSNKPVTLKTHIEVMAQDEELQFRPHLIDDHANEVISVYSVDIDSDGDTDLFANLIDGNSVIWYENDGYNNFIKHYINGLD